LKGKRWGRGYQKIINKREKCIKDNMVKNMKKEKTLTTGKNLKKRVGGSTLPHWTGKFVQRKINQTSVI